MTTVSKDSSPLAPLAPAVASRTRPIRFKDLFSAERISLLVGSYDFISAQLAARHGFDGIWASSFCCSLSLGLPDINLISINDQLRFCEPMRRAGLPILIDADTGFGDAMNAAHAAQIFESHGIGGMCIEDNRFPKRSSLYTGVHRELEPVQLFCEKIEAARKAGNSSDFSVVARTEALVAGLDLDAALERAAAYYQAGASAILVHSTSSDDDNVLRFGQRWKFPVPLICVPTTYYRTSFSSLFANGYQMAIIANHMLRAAYAAYGAAMSQVRSSASLESVEPEIATIAEVSRLVLRPDTSGGLCGVNDTFRESDVHI